MDEIKEGMSLEEAKKQVEWYSKRYGPYIEKRGLHNWRNLIRKPTLNEWVILFMLLMSLFIAWAYGEDTKQCRQTLEDLPLTACTIYSEQLRPKDSPGTPNISSMLNLSLKGDVPDEFSKES